MKTRAICIPRANFARLQETEVSAPESDQLLLKTHYSIISPGTELAVYRNDFWDSLPYFPGYGAVGEAIEVGSSLSGIEEGDLLFCYNGHAQLSLTKPGHVLVPLSVTADPKLIAFVRMAAVAMTALRVSPPELGDWVAVQGLGLVGNFAAQLFQLAGAQVIAIELSESRRAKAKACGIENVVDPSALEARDAVMALTGDVGVSTLVEATGIPALVEPACGLIGKEGELILLGSPRGELNQDVTTLLNQVHLWGNGCITLKGAHEWRYPIARQPNVKHSIQRNCELIVGLIESGKLMVEPLLTHVVPPDQCQSMYKGLKSQPDEYLGVLFDWQSGG